MFISLNKYFWTVQGIIFNIDILLGNDSQSEREKEKQPSRPGSAENKPKFMSTRKYFHKDEDFYVMDAKSIGKTYTICACAVLQSIYTYLPKYIYSFGK